tara:strand:+ start:368 stop:568 length:201 start_codon:yes stop_codon:yes gene_type:complete
MTRGDSGLTDSQFLKTQKILQRKNKMQIEKIETTAKWDSMQKRYESKKKPLEVKKSLWQKIKEFFR